MFVWRIGKLFELINRKYHLIYVISHMKRDHKEDSRKPGKWVYIISSEFDLVQV